MNTCVAAVVLNYRGSGDTSRCVESLLRAEYDSLKIIICDNQSGDGSEERLRSHFSAHSCVEVIQTCRNGGFAFGNNIGLRAALADPAVEYFWILNNDTEISGIAVAQLVEKARSDPAYGIVGATLVDFDRPAAVQARGGSELNRWTLVSRHIGGGDSLSVPVDEKLIERRMSFVSGASMFVSRSFIETVGLLCEDYFLYFEEADWVERAGGRFKLGYCQRAVVAHKEGATIGSASGDRRASAFSVFHICRSRLLFARKHRKAYLPFVYLRMLRYAFASLLKGDRQLAGVIWRAMRGLEFVKP